MPRFRSPLVAAVALTLAGLASAQDVVTLQSVTIDADDDVTVIYSKNFATCAHLRLGNATCTQFGPLVHVQNHFCAQGTLVAVTVPKSVLTAAFEPGIEVFLVHGNNPNVRSGCVTVVCDGVYGIGCAGTTGTPALAVDDACPPAPGAFDLTVSNGAAGSLGVVGFGTAQGTVPLFGCTLLLGGSLLATAVVPLDALGQGALSVPLPPGSGGFELTAQAFVFDVGGPQDFSATNGLRIRVQ